MGGRNMNEINLSNGEWKIMNLLWESSPRTIAQLVEALSEKTDWNKTTIFVMLKRLIAKGAVRMDDSGRSHLYYPVISHDKATAEETESFLEKVYNGSVGLLVSSLAGSDSLSEEDIAQLKEIINNAEKKLH